MFWKLWFLFWSFVKLYLIAIPCLLSQIFYKIKRPSELDAKVDQETVAIVTGGGKGIGFHISKQLAKLGVHVIIGVREQAVAVNALSQIRSEVPGAKVEALDLDLCSFSSIRKFAADFLAKDLPLHILINNAGVMLKPQSLTQDGLEEHLQVNYLGHHLLTDLLLERLRETGRPERHARVVNMSSHVHYIGNINLQDLNGREVYSAHAAYAQSKLALLLYAKSLQRHLSAEPSNVTVNCAHPGVVDTDLFRYTSLPTKMLSAMVTWMYKTPEQGAYTALYLALAPHLDGPGGRYYDNCEEIAPLTVDRAVEEALWTRSRELIGLTDKPDSSTTKKQ